MLKKALLFISCAFAFTVVNAYTRFSFNDLYGTELEFLAPGEAKPKERATKLAALIKKHTDPTKSSRSDFLSFMATLEQAHTAAPELINDLDIPEAVTTTYITGTDYKVSITKWITECNLFDRTNSVHREDQIARVKELAQSLSKPKTFKQKAAKMWASVRNNDLAGSALILSPVFLFFGYVIYRTIKK